MIIKNDGKTYFQIAVLMAILLHGVLVFFTFEKTYDAFVHIFFANHYVESWFDHWEYRWYTGFTMTSYPPLIHQLIAIFSTFLTLKGGFILTAVLSSVVFIRGVFVFSKLWVNEKSAGIASLLAVVSTSYVEALHVFGQLPSVTGIAILLNATPFIYWWIRRSRFQDLVISLSFLAVITSVHHVTTIFGMVFFIFPVIGLALLDNSIQEVGDPRKVGLKILWKNFLGIFKPSIILGFSTIIITLLTILPYWVWSSSDPITQVPIPHGSRDSFIEVFSSGLVFFIIPWGMLLFCLPHIFRTVFTKRTIILALSLTGAFLLGTGGTTPIPRMILGENAFNILTLDRFTYWASIMALPFFGHYIGSLLGGKFKEFLKNKIAYWAYRMSAAFWMSGIIISCILVININYFQPLQPPKIEIQPILNFLERDQHSDWRYLTLGFGDQVAWLSANTNALTVDGNYHSARRLPEMTTRKVERLENAKYLGTQGIAALHQFLTMPEKYHLKYIFSNDQFYNPILHFSGWQKLRGLENNIDIWMKPDIPPLPSILPRKDIPAYQQLLWSFLPITSLLILLLILGIYHFRATPQEQIPLTQEKDRAIFHLLDFAWIWILSSIILVLLAYHYKINKDQYSPENVITAYFDALDFKYFEKAFSFYDSEGAPSIDKMLLDLSREDDITTSYSKLNNLTFETILKEKNRAKVKVKADWITSISTFTSYHDFDLIKKANKWWIVFKGRDLEEPSDQIFSSPGVSFLNQGRRNVIGDQTSPSDILDRPELVILESNLVQRDSQYHIVGKIINMDNDPAYVNVSASLFDEDGNEIVTYNTREVVIHNLLPNEESYFRIDFEDIAGQVSQTEFPETYDPEVTYPFQFLKAPESFLVNAKSVVSTTSVYKNLAISEVDEIQSSISANFINTGTKEVNIPQVISAFYDDDQLIWVENQFLKKGVRPQRSKNFILNSSELNLIQLKEVGSQNTLLVNSQKSKVLPQKWEESRQKSKESFLLYMNKYFVDIIPSGYISQ